MENRSLKRPQGFSLAELTATLAIVGIGASLALPNLKTAINDGNQAAGVNQLVSAMHIARSEAITRNQEVAICPSNEGKRCDGAQWHEGWIIFTDADSDRQAASPEVIIRRGEALENLRIHSEIFDHYLVYRPDGHAMAREPAEHTGDFTVCDNRGAADARVLRIGLSGQPKLGERLSDGSGPDCDRG